MDRDDLISQLTLSLEIESDKIDDMNEEFHQDNKRPNYDEAPYEDVESEAFNTFLGVYFELPGDEKYSKVLACVK